MDASILFGVKFRGRMNFNLKKFVEMDEEKIAERENASKNIVN